MIHTLITIPLVDICQVGLNKLLKQIDISRGLSRTLPAITRYTQLERRSRRRVPSSSVLFPFPSLTVVLSRSVELINVFLGSIPILWSLLVVLYFLFLLPRADLVSFDLAQAHSLPSDLNFIGFGPYFCLHV